MPRSFAKAAPACRAPTRPSSKSRTDAFAARCATEVRGLAKAGRFDDLLIESTGIVEPLRVATTFEFRDENGRSLSDVARLDTMVTVVDAANLLKDYSSADFLHERGQAGALVRREAVGYWWAAIPKAKRPGDEETRARIKRGWDRQWGDRRQELVFNGLGEMNKRASSTTSMPAS